MPSELLKWPPGFERTPEHERENTSKFSANYQRSQRDLRKEMERIDVDEWRLEDVTGSGGDPGVVLRWTKDSRDHAVACDAYTTKKANLRAVYLWVQETRKRSQRPVRTGQSEFAAAQLPPADEEAVAAPAAKSSTPDVDPYEVVGLTRDVDPEVAEAAAKRLLRKHHPDSGEEPDREKFIEAKKAREILSG